MCWLKIKSYIRKVKNRVDILIYKLLIKGIIINKRKDQQIYEIHFNRHLQMIYAYNSDDSVVAEYPCRDDFFSGYNKAGVPREALPNGIYYDISAYIINGAAGPSFGNFYIETGDKRHRDIHGGGNSDTIANPYADYQGWWPTNGCLRMQNKDGVALSAMIIDCKNRVVLTVY